MLLIRAGSGVSAALRDTTFLGSEDSPVEAWKLLALQALDVTELLVILVVPPRC